MKKSHTIASMNLERDENGLLKTVDYKYEIDDLNRKRVDWKAMIPKKFLAPNKQKTTETDISKLKDEELLVLLGGYRYLAELRGFSAVNVNVKVASIEYSCVQVSIDFIPTAETNLQPVTFSASADAHFANTIGFGRLYFTRVAENRAFCCAVRNFLRVNIVSEEEITELPQEMKPKELDPVYMELEDLMIEKGLDFDFLKTRLVNENFDGAKTFEKVSDIPKYKIKEFIKKFKKAKKL